jgi:hypothetical protein
MIEFTQAVFTIDDQEKFNGIHDGRLWNGFAVPFFAYDEAVKIMEYVRDGINEDPIIETIDHDFMVSNGDGWYKLATQLLHEGRTYWLISDGWCWDKV